MPIIQSHSDESLLYLLSTGDRDAFTALYDKYWEPLFITAAKALRSEAEAADVVQDVFLNLWKRREALQVRDSLQGYLHNAVRFHALHFIEKNITRSDYLDHLQTAVLQYREASADQETDARKIAEVIDRAIKEMSPKMQEAYRLSREQHLTHKQIAEKMQISEETVKKHIQHALIEVKKALAASGFPLWLAALCLLR